MYYVRNARATLAITCFASEKTREIAPRCRSNNIYPRGYCPGEFATIIINYCPIIICVYTTSQSCTHRVRYAMYDDGESDVLTYPSKLCANNKHDNGNRHDSCARAAARTVIDDHDDDGVYPFHHAGGLVVFLQRTTTTT